MMSKRVWLHQTCIDDAPTCTCQAMSILLFRHPPVLDTYLASPYATEYVPPSIVDPGHFGGTTRSRLRIRVNIFLRLSPHCLFPPTLTSFRQQYASLLCAHNTS